MLGQVFQLNIGCLQGGIFLPFLWVPLQHLIILIMRNIFPNTDLHLRLMPVALHLFTGQLWEETGSIFSVTVS